MAGNGDYGYEQARHNAHAWQVVVQQLKELPGSNICWKCGKHINMKLPNNHPMQWTADHVQSMANGGDALALSNLRPAHRSCNSKRGRALQNQRASRVW